MAALAFRAIALAFLRSNTDTTEPHCQRAPEANLLRGIGLLQLRVFGSSLSSR